MTQNPAMTDANSQVERNKRAATEFIEAIAGGDQASIERLLHPQLTWWVLGFGELDRASFIASLRATIEASPERTLSIVGITAEGDRVAMESVGEFKMATTTYRNAYHYLFVFSDGRIKSAKEYLDTREAHRVFGDG